MLSRKQFKLLKKIRKAPITGSELSDDDRKRAKYLYDNKYCKEVFPKIDGVITTHYACTENGSAAIAEHRMNRLKLLPPWASLIISAAALIISIWL